MDIWGWFFHSKWPFKCLGTYYVKYGIWNSAHYNIQIIIYDYNKLWVYDVLASYFTMDHFALNNCLFASKIKHPIHNKNIHRNDDILHHTNIYRPCAFFMYWCLPSISLRSDGPYIYKIQWRYSIAVAFYCLSMWRRSHYKWCIECRLHCQA